MKALPISPQRFEAVSRRRSEISKLMGRVDQIELPENRGRYACRDTPSPSRAPPVIEIRGGLVPERDNHRA
jgi:hypothetical protein